MKVFYTQFFFYQLKILPQKSKSHNNYIVDGFNNKLIQHTTERCLSTSVFKWRQIRAPHFDKLVNVLHHIFPPHTKISFRIDSHNDRSSLSTVILCNRYRHCFKSGPRTRSRLYGDIALHNADGTVRSSSTDDK